MGGEGKDVLPGRDDEDNAHGGALDEATETGLVCVFEGHIGESLLGDVEHVVGAVESTANLAWDLGGGPDACVKLRCMCGCRSERCAPAHLEGELRGDLIAHLAKLLLQGASVEYVMKLSRRRIMYHECATDGDALLEGDASPLLLRRGGILDDLVEVELRRISPGDKGLLRVGSEGRLRHELYSWIGRHGGAEERCRT